MVPPPFLPSKKQPIPGLARDCPVEGKPPIEETAYPWLCQRLSRGRKTAYRRNRLSLVLEKTVPWKENRLSLAFEETVPWRENRLSLRRDCPRNRLSLRRDCPRNGLSKRPSKKPPIEETVEETPPNGGVSSIGR
jgi:hypothetical protein